MMKKTANVNTTSFCKMQIQGIHDAMSVLSGKWKFHILGTLLKGDKLGFMDLLREVEGIGSKMLSKELQDMEINRLIRREVLDTKPVTVEYSITEHGLTLSPVIDELAKWGAEYRDLMKE